MTHREIAKLANVSVSTVSKALSDSKEINSETVEKIKRIALETGYFKQKNIRKINNKVQKNNVIAVICPEIISIDYSRTITAIKKYVEQKSGSISVSIYDFNNSKLSSVVDNIILSGEADGIIIIGDENNNISSGLPIVWLGSCVSDIYDCVYTKYSDILDTLVKYLKDLGHTEIGFVGELLTVKTYTHFRNAMLSNGLPFSEDLCYTINKRFEEIGYDAADRIARLAKRPTAFVCAYDEIALALIYRLQLHGISVPEDISVVGINDIPFSSYSSKPLTTVGMSFEEQCRISVDILFDRIFGSTEPPKKVTIKHKLIIRDSAAKPKE